MFLTSKLTLALFWIGFELKQNCLNCKARNILLIEIWVLIEENTVFTVQDPDSLINTNHMGGTYLAMSLRATRSLNKTALLHKKID